MPFVGTGVAGLCGRRVSSSHLFTTSDISDVHMCGVSLCTNVRNRLSLFADAYAALVSVTAFIKPVGNEGPARR